MKFVIHGLVDANELRLFRPKACSSDGDSPKANLKDDSPNDTNQ